MLTPIVSYYGSRGSTGIRQCCWRGLWSAFKERLGDDADACRSFCRSRMALLGQTSCRLLEVWTIAALSFDGVFGEKSVEGGAADAEFSGGLTDIAPVFCERPLNKLLFN
jgi:hypothetical protein